MAPLFGSRRRGNSHQPPLNTTLDRSTNASATVAASQAFLKKSQSMTSLSSAAAAAALRSMTSTPEPVGSITTKRMARRGSISSITSGGSFSARGGMASRPPLQRQNSSGSMTERTFRSPSPGGRNGAASPAVDPNAPPVPAIPRSISNRYHQRSSSVEAAPARVVSPTPQGGRTMSMDRRSVQPQPTTKKPPRLSNVAEVDEAVERRNSVNFSRPISPPPVSPTFAKPAGKSYTHKQGSWFAGAAGDAASRGANQATGKKRVTSAPVASEPEPPVMVFDPASRTFIAKAAEPTIPASPPKANTGPRWDPSTRTVIPAATSAVKPIPPPVNTALEPPPRNPMRLSPTSSPRNSGLLESPTEQRSAALRENSAVMQSSAGLSKVLQAAGRKGSLEIPPGGAGRGRNTSLSPQRSAHFSASPVVQAQKHDPPGRSVSPVKSALKHSPASSIRTASPLPNVAAIKVAPSDASDTNSLYSQDGNTVKKKKSVRVSFDEHAQEIVPEASTAAPKAVIRERSPMPDDDTDDEIMQPRPALPSFGSVRRNRTDSPEIVEKVTEMPPERHEVSSDHAVGGILADAHATHQEAKTEPESVKDVVDDSFEPTVTSTPAKAPVSDGSVAHEDSEPKTRDFAVQDASADPGVEVPGIALLPPTPVLDDEQKQLGIDAQDEVEDGANRWSTNSMEGITVPGGWNDNKATTTSVVDTTPVPASELHAIDEDTDDAEFSDAAEDLTEHEDGGFASLDAIANSPMARTGKVKPGTAITSPPESPTMARASEDKNADWSEATAYWSKLTRAQREQIEREHMSSDDEAKPSAAEKKPRKKKSAMKPGTETVSPVQTPIKPALKKTMRAAPEPIRDDGSQGSEGEVHLRRTMRSNAGMAAQTMRTNSLRTRPQSAIEPPKATPAPRPAQRASQPPPPKPTAVRGDSYSAKIKDKYTNDSDSESSFKKKRKGPSTVDASGRFNMKRSMRAGAAEQPREARPSSPDGGARGNGRSFSIRSLSPSGSLFGRRKPESLRESLRSGAPDAGARRTTMRAQPPGPKPKPAAAAAPNPRFKSRFADSDDEDDDPRPSRGFFRSRFADSDDESEPASPTVVAADLRPVRGIPRKSGQEDGDSTDLEDEENGPRKAGGSRKKQSKPLVPDPADIEKAMEAARKKLGIPEITSASTPAHNREGSALNKGSLRKSSVASDVRPDLGKSRPEDVQFGVEKKKRGFMGSILRRNRNSTQSVPTMGSMAVEPAPPLPSSPLVTSTLPSTPTRAVPPPAATSVSPVSKLLLRRGRTKSSASTATAATAPPGVPSALSTRANDNENWPLPSPPIVTADGVVNGGDGSRPATSDDGANSSAVRLARSMRPDMPSRTASGNVNPARKSVRIAGVEGEREDPYAVYSNKTGRKKKFGKLRRAFGLND